MHDVAYNTGIMFSNHTAPTNGNRDSDEDLNGHGAALASSGYNLNGMTNSAGNNLQLMNNDILLGAIGNQLANNNIIQAPPVVQNNQSPPATNLGSFLFNPLAMFYQQHQQQPSVPHVTGYDSLLVSQYRYDSHSSCSHVSSSNHGENP